MLNVLKGTTLRIRISDTGRKIPDSEDPKKWIENIPQTHKCHLILIRNVDIICWV